MERKQLEEERIYKRKKRRRERKREEKQEGKDRRFLLRRGDETYTDLETDFAD